MRREKTDPNRLPDRVVALGGGTGLPAVLRGLRQLVVDGEMADLTAIVAMSDDGGSSGRLRRSRGLPPPGDVRNCLVALSAEEDLLAGLFQHRYSGAEELGGHNLGNLILAALAEQTGSFLKAVEVSSRVLRTVGRILPVTLEDVSLVATLEDGSRLVGETAIGLCRKQIRSVTLHPRTARPAPESVEAIVQADLVVIGPGSLFTSVLPTLVLDDVARALRDTRAVRVLVGNLVSERGEAAGLTLDDHVRIIEAHAGGAVVDAILVHHGSIDDATLARYQAEGASPLVLQDGGPAGPRVIRRNLLAEGVKLRHDPAATAAGLLLAWHELSRPNPVRQRS
ncbi:MAG TPA: uridine diphosphate-N-acetylglucosamine-binding protein YvcK [Candidatus Polarisedimenticolaceae bacterium]|nr:uridine diphosphate-N-acetylglucosamine-binding protein YvcK [Candidatus Polarisedimenticolaceae bacterium]